jgi:plastocyanin
MVNNGVGDRPFRRFTLSGHAALVVASVLAASTVGSAATAQGAKDGHAGCTWSGGEAPLPLNVKTPADLVIKTGAERYYLLYNLLVGGKLALQCGDPRGAVEKWEELLRAPGLDPALAKAIAPMIAETRQRAGLAAVVPGATVAPTIADDSAVVLGAPVETAAPPEPRASRSARVTVTGTVSGGGQGGPAGTVLWLRRIDGPTPAPAPLRGAYVGQRDKAFVPHVLVVPQGTRVEFRNDDRIYHNVFSIRDPNGFDGGIRSPGANFDRIFDKPGPVDLLCNIHSAMTGYVFVVDSPYYAKAGAGGAFTIRNVPPGRYTLEAWHEAAASNTTKRVTVGPEGLTGLTIAVGGSKRPAPFVPDKYGHPRQAQLGY